MKLFKNWSRSIASCRYHRALAHSHPGQIPQIFSLSDGASWCQPQKLSDSTHTYPIIPVIQTHRDIIAIQCTEDLILPPLSIIFAQLIPSGRSIPRSLDDKSGTICRTPCLRIPFHSCHPSQALGLDWKTMLPHPATSPWHRKSNATIKSPAQPRAPRYGLLRVCQLVSLR